MEIGIEEAKKQTCGFVEEIAFSHQKASSEQVNLFSFGQYNESPVSIVLLH